MRQERVLPEGVKQKRQESDYSLMDNPRPFAHEGNVPRVAPFAAAACFAFMLVPLPPGEEDLTALLVAGLLTVAILASLMFPWKRFPRALEAVPPFAYFLVIALLRHAEGGAVSGYGVLILVPVIWLALYGTRRQLIWALVAMVALFVLPILLLGTPHYPASEWRRALMWGALGPLIGLTVQGLVEDRSQLVRQLHQLARTDALTGLPNRRAWNEELPREVARAQRSGQPLCVAILDLDHFKAFNDTRGHPAGDKLLEEAAAAWRENARPSDFIARYGGEEFALLLPDCPQSAANAVVERFRRATPGTQTSSAGVACWNGVASPEALVGLADAALYAAKSAGRDRVVVATEGERSSSSVFSAQVTADC